MEGLPSLFRNPWVRTRPRGKATKSRAGGETSLQAALETFTFLIGVAHIWGLHPGVLVHTPFTYPLDK